MQNIHRSINGGQSNQTFHSSDHKSSSSFYSNLIDIFTGTFSSLGHKNSFTWHFFRVHRFFLFSFIPSPSFKEKWAKRNGVTNSLQWIDFNEEPLTSVYKLNRNQARHDWTTNQNEQQPTKWLWKCYHLPNKWMNTFSLLLTFCNTF